VKYYVVYDFSEAECSKAYQMFNGRWYAQKQLSCQFCPVTKWKTAICGEFMMVSWVRHVCKFCPQQVVLFAHRLSQPEQMPQG